MGAGEVGKLYAMAKKVRYQVATNDGTVIYTYDDEPATRETLKDVIARWRTAGDESEAEKYLDYIMDGDWTRYEFYKELLLPALCWHKLQNEDNN